MRPARFVMYCSKGNRYSINALVGALDHVCRGSEVEVNIEKTPHELLARLEQPNEPCATTIAAFSFCTPEIWSIADVLRDVRQRCGDGVLCIAGGPHPTGAPMETLDLGFDHVLRGEGEGAIVEIAKCLVEGQALTGIEGLLSRGSSLASSPPRRNLGLDLDAYPPFSISRRMFGPIEITRGCPYACAFCQTSRIFGCVPRHRTIENICGHFESMVSLGLRDFRAITPNALSYGSPDGRQPSLEKVEGLLSALRGLAGDSGRIFFGTFPSEVRPEHVTEESLEILRRYADNDNIIMGAQSGSDRMLERLHRGHSVADVYRAVSLALKAGYVPNVDFIFGLPGETKRDMLDTLQVIDDLTRVGARVHAHAFIPLPQTPLADKPASPLDKAVKRKMNQLSPLGQAYGEWIKQETEARRIADYFRTGSLGGSDDE